MALKQDILFENKAYWTQRAPTYSEVNQLELTTAQRQKWSDCLHNEIVQHFPDHAPETLRVLEVGTGPGFFAILLQELGYDVTAIEMCFTILLNPSRLGKVSLSAKTLDILRLISSRLNFNIGGLALMLTSSKA